MPRPSIGETPMTGAELRHGIVPRMPMTRLSFASAGRPIGTAGSGAGMIQLLHL